MTYSHQFRMLAQEGHLASNALLSGFEGIAKSDYYKPGTIYSALFNIAIGLERMMKLAFVVKHMINHELSTPSDKQLKKFSHSAEKLYVELRGIGKSIGIIDGWYSEGDLHFELLRLVSHFAVSSRYHNLDQITQGKVSDDPLIAWFNIHMRIAQKYLPHRKLVAINQEAIAHCDRHQRHGYVMGMRGEYELIVDIIRQVEMARLSRGHCVWTVLEIIQPLYRLIDRVCSEAHAMEIEKGIQQPVVPHLEEFFPFGLTFKQTAIRRKAWTSLFEMAGRY